MYPEILALVLSSTSVEVTQTLLKAISKKLRQSNNKEELPLEIKNKSELETIIRILEEENKKVSTQVAETQTFDVLDDTYRQRSEMIKEQKRQASIAFNLTVFFLISGSLIIFLGIGLAVFGQVSVGIISGVSGLLLNFFGGGVFLFYRHSNDRLDKSMGELKILVDAQHATLLKAKYGNSDEINN